MEVYSVGEEKKKEKKKKPVLDCSRSCSQIRELHSSLLKMCQIQRNAVKSIKKKIGIFEAETVIEWNYEVKTNKTLDEGFTA